MARRNANRNAQRGSRYGTRPQFAGCRPPRGNGLVGERGLRAPLMAGATRSDSGRSIGERSRPSIIPPGIDDVSAQPSTHHRPSRSMTEAFSGICASSTLIGAHPAQNAGEQANAQRPQADAGDLNYDPSFSSRAGARMLVGPISIEEHPAEMSLGDRNTNRAPSELDG
jgi:hypothetical protein